MECDFTQSLVVPGLPSPPFHLDASTDFFFLSGKSCCCGPASRGGGDDGGLQLLVSCRNQLYQSLGERQEMLEAIKLQILSYSFNWLKAEVLSTL